MANIVHTFFAIWFIVYDYGVNGDWNMTNNLLIDSCDQTCGGDNQVTYFQTSGGTCVPFVIQAGKQAVINGTCTIAKMIAYPSGNIFPLRLTRFPDGDIVDIWNCTSSEFMYSWYPYPFANPPVEPHRFTDTANAIDHR